MPGRYGLAGRRNYLNRLFFCLLVNGAATAWAEPDFLSERNMEAPFCYLQAGTRSWPFIKGQLPEGTEVSFVARRDGNVVSQGNELSFSGLTVTLTDAQKLEITSQPNSPALDFALEVTLTLSNGQVESQQLSVRPAPPNRPISYLADLGDDFIRIFMDPHNGHWKPVTRSAFDQYFRRCQAHGITRLIIWQRPCPIMCDPNDYEEDVWSHYEQQARAIVESEELLALITSIKQRKLKNNEDTYVPWELSRKVCEIRLMGECGPLFAQSAAEHGIALTASFRPMETALTKYWEVPTFDHDGKYLWGFLPEATPLVNARPEESCFAHYRTILQEMGYEDRGRLGVIEIPGAQNAAAFVKRFESDRDNLRIVVTNCAPVQKESLVLQRQPDGDFRLRRFGEFKHQADQQQDVLDGYQVEEVNGQLRITGLDVPMEYRYLILSNPSAAQEAIDASAVSPVKLWAKAGNRLARTNVFWVLDDTLDEHELTKVAGFPIDGKAHTEFDATEASRMLLKNGPKRLPLRGHQLVIDLGSPWSVEMFDLNRPAMRANAVKELASILALPAFDELFINTRSHTRLASYTELAYAPLAAADDPKLRAWAANEQLVDRITVGQPKEWEGRCQTEDCPFRWRYMRNREIANGVRRLLEDLAQTFPGIRTRILIPQQEEAVFAVRNQLETTLRSDGTPYGRDYLPIWSTINSIRVHCEGMAVVDLEGLSTEPVFFGFRNLHEPSLVQLYLHHSFEDLADNRGSSFHGPRSFFYEAQETLRGDLGKEPETARRREEIICNLLSHSDEINEVILYEAADWLYNVPISDQDRCSHTYLDHCPMTSPTQPHHDF